MQQSGVVIEDITDQYEQEENGFATPPGSVHSQDYHSVDSDDESLELTDGDATSTAAHCSSQTSARGSEVTTLDASPASQPAVAQEASPPGDVTVPPDQIPGALETSGSPAEGANEEKLQNAEALKQEGNQLYAQGNLQEALGKYRQAAETAPESAAGQRAIYHCNEAAVQLKLQAWTDAAKAASQAIQLDETYVKAYSRRAAAYQELDDLEHALADHQKVAELSGSPQALQEVKRLTPIVEERREKLKEEMMGKLKDLGNTVLGKFGMSLDNFKAVKDPNTGSYSINFQQ